MHHRQTTLCMHENWNELFIVLRKFNLQYVILLVMVNKQEPTSSISVDLTEKYQIVYSLSICKEKYS